MPQQECACWMSAERALLPETPLQRCQRHQSHVGEHSTMGPLKTRVEEVWSA